MHDSFFRRNGLGIVVLLMMLAAWSAQCVTGFAAHNEELIEHGRPSVEFAVYLVSGDFWSATPENWESEFLQMGVYVLLTVWLRQKGSAESRPVDDDGEEKSETPAHLSPNAWRKGGIVRWLYANSLSLAFLFLFLLCFCGHLLGSWRKSLETAQLHHQPAETLGQYAVDASF